MQSRTTPSPERPSAPPTLSRDKKRRRVQPTRQQPSVLEVLGLDQRVWTSAQIQMELGEGDAPPLVVQVAGSRASVLHRHPTDPRLYMSRNLFAKELLQGDDVSKEQASELLLALAPAPEVVPFHVGETGDGHVFTVMRRLPLMGADPESQTPAAYRSLVDQLDSMYRAGLYYFDLKTANLLWDGAAADAPGGAVRVTDVAEIMSDQRLMMLAANSLTGPGRDWLTAQLHRFGDARDLENLRHFCQGWNGTLATFVPTNMCTLMKRFQPTRHQVVEFTMAPTCGAIVSFRPGQSEQRAQLCVGAMRWVWGLLTCWGAMTVALELAGFKWSAFYQWELGEDNPVRALARPKSEDARDLVDCAAAAYDACWRLLQLPGDEPGQEELDLIDLLEPESEQ